MRRAFTWLRRRLEQDGRSLYRFRPFVDVPPGAGGRERRRAARRLHRRRPPTVVHGAPLNLIRRAAGRSPVWTAALAPHDGGGLPPGAGGDEAGSREPRRPRGPRPSLSAAAEPPGDEPGLSWGSSPPPVGLRGEDRPDRSDRATL